MTEIRWSGTGVMIALSIGNGQKAWFEAAPVMAAAGELPDE